MTNVKTQQLVIFDQAVTKRSPAGSCVLDEVLGLAVNYSITVFSNSCDAATEHGVNWIYIPLPLRPLLLRYIIFQLLAPIYYALWRLQGNHADIIQTTQGQYIGADIVYAHFCHKAYLKGAWKISSVHGLKRLARFLNHLFNALTEREAFKRARKIIVPSEGLARELVVTYPFCRDKIVVLANPVDLQRFTRLHSRDIRALRLELGIRDNEVVCVFVALGDFSRKGLGLTIEALGQLVEADRTTIRILVVGGNTSEIAEFSELSQRNFVASQLTFVGLQSDICPYLWASDVLVFPSAYEIFSLAILQAAAAGLPVLVSVGLYGAEEFIVDNVNGWVVERSVNGVKSGLLRILANRERLNELSVAVRASVVKYSRENFVEGWRVIYESIE